MANKKFPTLEEKRAAEAKAQAEEKPIDSGHVMDAPVRRAWTKPETEKNLTLFQEYLANKGAKVISRADMTLIYNNLIEDHDVTPWVRIWPLAEADKLSFEAILLEPDFARAFRAAIYLGYNQIYEKKLISPDGKGFTWQREPHISNLLANVEAAKGNERLWRMRCCIPQLLWFLLEFNCRRHGLKNVDQASATFTELPKPEPQPEGVSSADVPLSDHAKNHPGKVDAASKYF